MKPPSLAIKHLIDGLITDVENWDIHVGDQSTETINVIVCSDASGAETIRVFDEDDIYRPLVGITIITPDYALAYEKYDEIRAGFKRVDSFVEDDALYCGIWLQNDLGYIGKDEKDRHMFTITVQIYRQEI